MMIKVCVPNRFQLKTVSRFRTVLMPGQGESALYRGSRYPAAAFRHRRGGEDDCMPGNRRGSKSPCCPD